MLAADGAGSCPACIFTVQDLATARAIMANAACVNFMWWSSGPATNGTHMAHQQGFSGLDHNLSETFTAGCVRLKPRERPLSKTSFQPREHAFARPPTARALIANGQNYRGSGFQVYKESVEKARTVLCLSAHTPMSRPCRLSHPPPATCSQLLHQCAHADAGTCSRLGAPSDPPIIVASDGQLGSAKGVKHLRAAC